MNVLPKSIVRVIESFEKLPGIGPKSAQRLALYLLHVPQIELDKFSESVKNLKINTKLCSVCKNVTENDPCPICDDQNRKHSIICIVENPGDVVSMEKTGKYKGVYHVLHGHLDPLNNIGPDEIFVSDLIKRVKSNSQITELILATNPNMEGEATAMYIQKQLSGLPAQAGDNRQQTVITITRLAHGLPVGGDIEYADEVTLSRALEGRRQY